MQPDVRQIFIKIIWDRLWNLEKKGKIKELQIMNFMSAIQNVPFKCLWNIEDRLRELEVKFDRNVSY